MQILLRNQKSRIVNGETTSKYFKLKKRQGDLISAYLFILVLEIAFFYTKKIRILRALIFLIMYSYILLMLTMQHFL